MRKSWMIAAAALAVLSASGCGSGDKAGDSASKEPEPAAAGDAVQAPDHEPAVEEGDVALASVTVAGTLGCGHCTYNVVDHCAAAVKGDDGTVYLVDGDPKELMDVRFDQPKVTVSGRVSTQDGLVIIHADSYTFN